MKRTELFCFGILGVFLSALPPARSDDSGVLGFFEEECTGD